MTVIDYTRTVTIQNRGSSSPITTPTIGNIVAGNLDEYVLRVEVTNSTVDEVNSMLLTLRIDPDGTFIRDGPILVDETTKTNYVIEVQISQTPNTGKLFRFEISNSIIKEDEVNGEVLQIVGRGLEYRFKEVLDAEPIFLQAPSNAFFERIGNFNLGGSGILVTGQVPNITLPNSEALKRDWIPTGPQPIHDHFKEILDRIALSGASGGVLEDYFWDAVPSATNSLAIEIFANTFGTNDSGVTIDPEEFESAEQKDKLYTTDSKRFKNQVWVRGQAGSATLPMDHTRFRSDFIHARFRKDWSSTTAYKAEDKTVTPQEQGDLVKHEVSGVDRFYKCIIDNTNSAPPNANWTEDFIIANEASRISPWTINQVDQIANLAMATPAGNWDPKGDGATFYGACVDHNFVRGNYDRINFNNEYENITLKWFQQIRITPPATLPTRNEEMFHGQRYLINDSNVDPADWGLSGGLGSIDNFLVQFDAFPSSGGFPEWKLSKAPVEDDVLTDMQNGTIKRFDGVNWVDGWSLATAGNEDKHTHLHPVDNVQVVEGATEGVNSAIQLTFNWDEITGSDANKSSRGIWWNMWFPYPRQSSSHGNTGHEYGNVNGSMSGLDTINMEFNSDGGIGWNRGLDSEDLGNIRAVSFKIKCEWLNGAGDKVQVGFADESFRLFFTDLFDHVLYYDFKLRRNGGWQLVKVPIGFNSPMQRYDNRIDELKLLYEFDFEGDFFLPEKEYTGVQFDWRFVRMLGIQWMGAYGDQGNYKGHEFAFTKDLLTQIVQHVGDSGILGASTAAFGLDVNSLLTEDLQNVKSTTITIDEFKFDKDLYVNSDSSTVSNVRSTIRHKESEFDYLSAQRVAQAERERLSFFPQEYHLKSFGDVRIKVGDAITVTGEKVPSLTGTNPLTGSAYLANTQVLGVQKITHIIDENSYTMDIFAIRKFLVP